MRTLELPDVTEWTPEALERLSPEFRYEVREGNLVVMAAARRPWHADVQSRVRNLLVDPGRPTYIEQGVILPHGEIRTCDVGVFAPSVRHERLSSGRGLRPPGRDGLRGIAARGP